VVEPVCDFQHPFLVLAEACNLQSDISKLFVSPLCYPQEQRFGED
jgi:hypothetical protein